MGGWRSVIQLHGLALCACNAILGLDELPIAPPHVGADAGDQQADGSIDAPLADGSGSPASSPDAGGDAATERPRLVFTSVPLQAGVDFFMRKAANESCTSELGRPAVAWLSVGDGNAIDDLPDRTWVNRYGELVFADKEAITAGRGPEHSIYPRGSTDLTTLVWTGTDPNGEVVQLTAHVGTCDDWTSSTAGATAIVGTPDARFASIPKEWTNVKQGQSCETRLRLYCFEL